MFVYMNIYIYICLTLIATMYIKYIHICYVKIITIELCTCLSVGIYIQLLLFIFINVGGGRSSFKGMWKMEGIGAFTVLSNVRNRRRLLYVASKSCDIFVDRGN